MCWQSKPIADKLSKAVGMKVEMFVGSDYNATIEALRAVAEGKVEAASVADRILERAYAKGLADRKKIKVIWESDLIPNNPMLYRKGLSEDLKKRIRDAFYGFKNLAFGEMGTVARFDPATDKTYDVIRQIATALKL